MVSQIDLGPKEIPVAGVSGQSSAYTVLFFGPFGDDSLPKRGMIFLKRRFWKVHRPEVSQPLVRI